ncbi:hypothetical protein [Croceicoccus sp. YJ47]|uniref:hypothetical protein n=1 Tax=Croceicoccus sp. YJ47 TaxID=2798724 RepID=UPI001920BF3F|nr:hypothetical protein [Croceicoccus sp. YJ47]QQN73442.1 hypothetical protein JD971_11505 [Croceicoccus sp. YJ47]
MAEIPVEKKSSKSWLWLLLALILGALILWWILADDDDDAEMLTTDTEVSETADMGDANATPTMASDMTIAAIAANPQAYIGQEFTGEADVGGPLTDRGFWIENDGARIFAIIIDEPREVPLDINPGQRLSITGGTIREAGEMTDVEGVPLDEDTRNVLADQEIFLIVDEANIDIIDEA